MQIIMGTIGAPNHTDKHNIATLNVARRIVHDPRIGNTKAFSNKVLRKLEKIAEES